MNTGTNSLGLKLSAEVLPDPKGIETVVLLHHDESRPGELETIEEIHTRAETMTSLLKSILDYEPATHWGINE